MPTGGERMVWAPGDGSTLGVFDTGLGKVGGLICWENYMPLARYAVYRAGPQIWVAPTADDSEGWLVSMRHIAIESGAFVVNVTGAELLSVRALARRQARARPDPGRRHDRGRVPRTGARQTTDCATRRS